MHMEQVVLPTLKTTPIGEVVNTAEVPEKVLDVVSICLQSHQ